LDGWKMESNIANIAGSSMGIVGGGLILGGFIFPPLAIPGIVMSLVGAGGNIGSSIARYNVVKNLAAEAQTLCEEDALLLSAFFDAAENYLQLNAGIGSAAAAATGPLLILPQTVLYSIITRSIGKFNSNRIFSGHSAHSGCRTDSSDCRGHRRHWNGY
ncbi:hypothetical protein PENTCL1PPCAC_5236, partial [Pristionchus entomophagus]